MYHKIATLFSYCIFWSGCIVAQTARAWLTGKFLQSVEPAIHQISRRKFTHIKGAHFQGRSQHADDVSNLALLADKDAVQELTNIFVSDETRLVQSRGAGRDKLQVVAREDELVLDVVGADDGDALGHLNAAQAALAQEVADLHHLRRAGALLGVRLHQRHVDGEVRVCEAHLVAEALGDARDHVLDVRAHRAQARQLLAVAKPHVHAQRALAALVDGEVDGLKGAAELAPGAFHSHCPAAALDRHCTQQYNGRVRGRCIR